MKAVVTAAIVAGVLLGLGAQAKTRRVHVQAGETTTVATRAIGDANGGWSVEAATTVGQCAGLIPSGFDVADGRITGASGVSGDVWGYVDGDGQIIARVTTRDGHIARFHGNLRGGHGSGAWSSSTDFCGGTWRGTRGGSESAAR